jgi:N-acylneuraminate cytidylyltransferase
MQERSFRAIGFIFARGGSKGVPGKNIKMLSGKPLIAYSIQVALACPSLETVFVSTDDENIAAVASEYGAEIPFVRPPELATDSAPEWLAWRHAIEWVQRERGDFDAMVSLPATSPFRNVEDVESCIALLKGDAKTDAVITVKEADRSPYFNMVTLDGEGYANVVIKPAGKISRRQDAPSVYDVTTVAYAARPKFVMTADRLFDGNIRTVIVPPDRALDIDTPHDFMLAEAIAQIKGSRSSDS